MWKLLKNKILIDEHENSIRLGPTEHAIVEALMSNKNNVVKISDMGRLVGSENIARIRVKNVRDKFIKINQACPIKTDQGQGYIWSEETNKHNVLLNIEAKLFEVLKRFAEDENISVEDYIVSEILIYLQGHCIFCPKCKKPVLDERRIIQDSYYITCNFCGHEWEIVDDI